jgi:hypothetical protein
LRKSRRTKGDGSWPSHERAGELLRFWRDYLEDAPDELGGAPAFLTAPPTPFVPERSWAPSRESTIRTTCSASTRT